MKILIVLAACFLYGTFAALAVKPPQKLIAALIMKESSNDDWAIGDTNKVQWAYGPLQIRQIALDDVNRKRGTKYKAEDCLGNRQLSIWVCQEYIDMWATQKRLKREPTLEDMARIWNGGGPIGWKKPSTRSYWYDVQRYMK